MRILIFAALLAIAGCATQSDTSTNALAAPPGTETTSAAAPAAQAAPAAAAVETPAAPVPATAAPIDEEAAAFKPPPGYRKELMGGAVVYCTKMVVLGSRFAKKDCRTQAELEDLALQGASMRGEMQQRQSVCTSASGCASN